MTKKIQQHEAGWKCPECGLKREETCGPDPCFKGLLPGVKYACCGHGGYRKHKGKHASVDGYIMFEDGRVIRFTRLTASYGAVKYIEICKTKMESKNDRFEEN